MVEDHPIEFWTNEMRQSMAARQDLLMRSGTFAFALILLAGCAMSPDEKFQPAPTAYYTVPVQKGESLTAIASRWQVREDDLLAVNNLYDRSGTAKGDTIRVPAYGRLPDGPTGAKASTDSSPRESVSTPVRASMRRAP